MQGSSNKLVVAAEREERLLFLSDTPEIINAVVPLKHMWVEEARTYMCVAPWKDEVARILRNMGYEAPSRIRSFYDWSGQFTPRQVQEITAEFLVLHKRAYCLNSMGTGKTISALWAYDYLRTTGAVNKALIVAPLSTLSMTWGRELTLHFPHLDFKILHGTRTQRLDMLSEPADVYIINHDGLKIIAGALETRSDIDLIIFDEVSTYKNPSTQRWKIANAITNKQQQGSRWAWGLTGTPTPNSPLDAFGQVKLITPARLEKFHVRSLTAFRNATMTQIATYKWKPRPEALEFVSRVMQPAVRFTLEDCVELPEEVFIVQSPELSKKQVRAYEALKKALSASIDGDEITAVNAGVLFGKLLQVSCGAAYKDDTDDGDKTAVDLAPTPRLDAMVEVIHESEGKVLVFVPFKHVMNLVKNKLDKEGVTYVSIDGATSAKARNKAFNAFKTDDEVKVLVAQPQTMSHGLTLTEATTTLWYGLVTSNETFEQANARVRRPGQTKKTRVVVFATTEAEKKLLTALRDKQAGQNKLLTLLKETINE